VRSRSVRRWLCVAVLASTPFGLGSGCAAVAPSADGAKPAVAGAKTRTPTKSTKTGAVLEGSRLIPDIVAERGVVAMQGGETLLLTDQMRIVTRPDGSIERASQLLPLGRISSVRMPDRLGGGYVFVSVGGSGTQVWRSKEWLGELSPLVAVDQVADELSPIQVGFDRLYLRLKAGNRLVAMHPETGARMPLGNLPPAPAYGGLVFADGWRGVVEADLRGLMATFDAGATWRPLPIRERVLELGIEGGDPMIEVSGGGRYVLDARGALTFRALGDQSEVDSAQLAEAGAEHDAPERASGPFGDRPLRAAVEDGWPDGERSAVVARRGALARVSLQDGAIVDLDVEAFEESEAQCHAVRLGRRSRAGTGIGFICGEVDGPTVVYQFEPPLGMRKVMRFEGPRFVVPSGNGALVVRGSCSDGSAPDAGGSRPYCIRSVDGGMREIRVRGDLGAERLVALSDGRVAVIVPPRPGASGQLSIIRGSAATHVPLKLPTEPVEAAEEVRRGMWLEGFEEREPGVLGGWVESGGPVVGIEIDLDGKVKVGELMDAMPGGVIPSGRHAVVRSEGGVAMETTDGGMTFDEFELPELPEDAFDSATRACGPAGCVLAGWIRVGWGDPIATDDLAKAPKPEPLYRDQLRPVSARVSLTCRHERSVTPPLAARSDAAPPRSTARHAARPAAGSPIGRSGIAISPEGPWLPFRNTPPPDRAKEDVGLDHGDKLLRVYAWGRRGADWTRVGRWLIRFDDPFDPRGGVRSTSVTATPWLDEGLAATAVGAPSRGMHVGWSLVADPGGRAAIATACRGASCDFYAVGAGQPISHIRDRDGNSMPRMRVSSAVRVGDTWYLLMHRGGDALDLYRVELGVAHHVRALLRPRQDRFAMSGSVPRLVRRALSPEVGIFVTIPAGPDSRHGEQLVFPLSGDTGRMGEPVVLGHEDLAARSLAACAKGQDGWLLTLSADRSIRSIDAGADLDFEGLTVRVRLDPGSSCVDAAAATLDGSFKPPSRKPDVSGPTWKLVASEPSGRRWVLSCKAK